MKRLFPILFLFQTLPFSGCLKHETAVIQITNYKTKNVVVVIIDGPRYSETWGDPEHKYVPRLASELAREGIINTDFWNEGPTYTNAGHAAITTGVHQEINNSGQELPRNPSFFQYWLEATGKPRHKAWLVTSKDKLNILADTKDNAYAGKFRPETNCGVNGPGTGYREDSITFRVAKQILTKEKPNLLLINFKEPDASGHAGNWNGYLNGIRRTDEYVYQLWKFLETDPHYKGQTTLMVTNDHGRHSDNHKNGFASHGDNCEGCRHINFFAAGPDFKQNITLHKAYNQTDIPATIAALMGFTMKSGNGEVMKELFIKP